MDQTFWDERYRSRDRLFSGYPNAVLVAEVENLPPGQALDVGCGEGADAHWLAARGWLVTAVDISRVALERAAEVAPGGVCWTHADLSVTPPPARSFDLVSAQYFPLTKENSALDGLLAAVAPGGTLLVVGHDPADLPPEFNRDDYYWPSEIAAMLGQDWIVQVDERRKRTTPPPPGTNHVNDTVLRAQRRPA
jgi:SAM-dependent methyltransferase